MTDDEKVYKIAELCGAKWYRLIPSDDYERSLSFDNLNMGGKGLSFADGNEKIVQIHTLPAYLNDLNAMHEVEKTLKTDEIRFLYETTLHSLNMKYMGQASVWETVHATAKQRAEAFILTMEKK